MIQRSFNYPCLEVDPKYDLISLNLLKLSSYDADVTHNARNI